MKETDVQRKFKMVALSMDDVNDNLTTIAKCEAMLNQMSCIKSDMEFQISQVKELMDMGAGIYYIAIRPHGVFGSWHVNRINEENERNYEAAYIFIKIEKDEDCDLYTIIVDRL